MILDRLMKFRAHLTLIACVSVFACGSDEPTPSATPSATPAADAAVDAPDAGQEVGGDSDAQQDVEPQTATVEGFVFDVVGTLQSEEIPIEGATIVVDTGEELSTLETDAEGRFVLDGLNPNVPITLTAAHPDMDAITHVDLDPASAEAPLEFFLARLNPMQYERVPVTVTATVEGALPGASAFVFVYGGNDQRGQTNTKVTSADPIEIAFDTFAYTTQDKLFFTFCSLDGSNAETWKAALVEVDVDAVEPLQVSLQDEAIVQAVRVARPTLEGVPLENFDQQMKHWLGISRLAGLHDGFLGTDAITGWSQDPAWEADDIVFTLPHVPVSGFDTHVRILVSENFSSPSAPIAVASVPLPQDGSELDVTLLDAPGMQDKPVFEPGATLTWAPVDGASFYEISVYDYAGTSWRIQTADNELTFPRLPQHVGQDVMRIEGDYDVSAVDKSVQDVTRVSITRGDTARWSE